MTDTALIIAAHPDDEILGCGGTMAKLASNGTNVHVAILAEGITSREKKRDRESNFEKISSLKKSSETANRVVGVTDVILHDFPDNRMDGCELVSIRKLKISKRIGTENFIVL